MLRRITSVLTVLAFGVLVVSSGPPQLVTTAQAGPSGPSSDVRDSSAKGTLIVKGVAKRKSGSVIADGKISVHNLTTDPKPALIGAGHTNSRGHFKISIHRSADLANYASHHDGQLNLVLWVYKGNRVYLRAERVPYRKGSGKSLVPAQDEYALGAVRLLASLPVGASKQTLSYDGVLDTDWVTTGRISADRGFTSELKYFQNIETSADFGVIYAGKFTATGSLSLDESSGHSLEMTVTGRRVRRAMQLEMETLGFTVCDYRSWLHDGHQCANYAVPRWTHEFRDVRVKYRDCASVPEDYRVWRRVSKASAWKVTKTRGKGFHSSWGLAGLGVSLGMSTKFSETNFQSFSVPNARHTPIARFCIAGIDGEWDEASEVVTESQLPTYPQPCHVRKDERAWRRC